MIQGAWWTRSGTHEDVPMLGGIGPRPPRTSRRPRRAELSSLVKCGARGSRPGDTASRAVPRPMAAHQLPACPGAEGSRDQLRGRGAVLGLGNKARGDPLSQATGSFRNLPSCSSKLSLVIHLPAWRPGQHVDIL